MRPSTLPALAAAVTSAAAILLSAPAGANPIDPIPGDGVFQVGTDIAPGLYRTNGPSGPLILIFGQVQEASMCTWFTHSTPAATRDDVVATNTAMGPMYVQIPDTVAAFETLHCEPWTRVG